MEVIIFLLIVAVAVYIFNFNDNKNLEQKKEIKNFQPAPKKFVKVIFKQGDVKQYDYFLGDNFDIQVGDFVEVIAHGKFSGKDELKIVQVVYISKPGEISYKATKTVIKKSQYRKW